jgi:hypothetical protein
MTAVYVTAVAVGKSQRLYSGVRTLVVQLTARLPGFMFFYLSSINSNVFGWWKGVGF